MVFMWEWMHPCRYECPCMLIRMSSHEGNQPSYDCFYEHIIVGYVLRSFG